jgi:hypothetical protein
LRLDPDSDAKVTEKEAERGVALPLSFGHG